MLPDGSIQPGRLILQHPRPSHAGIVLAAALAVLFASSGAFRAESQARVATWNLAATQHFWSKSKGEVDKMREVMLPRVAEAIRAMDPDVIGLTEVESEEALDMLVSILREQHDRVHTTAALGQVLGVTGEGDAGIVDHRLAQRTGHQRSVTTLTAAVDGEVQGLEERGGIRRVRPPGLGNSGKA